MLKSFITFWNAGTDNPVLKRRLIPIVKWANCRICTDQEYQITSKLTKFQQKKTESKQADAICEYQYWYFEHMPIK
jgi:hypothetical protein